MMGILKNVSHWLDKDFAEVTIDDMESFIHDFQNNLITQDNGKEYAKSTKCTIKKVIRKFWKWLKGDSLRYPPEVDWIDTTEPDVDIPTISIDEVKQVIEAATHTNTRAFVAMLFETGARIGELLNVRLDDITRDDQYKMPLLTIRNETSKTKGRTIPIAIFQDELDVYLKHIKEKKPDQEYLFPRSYKASLELLRRLGNKVLGKPLNNNMIRHSSATYFANHVNTAAQMNHRYGWSMSSKMAQRYIDRAGVQLIESAQKTIQNQGTRKKADAEALVLRNRYLESEVRSLRDEVSRVKSQVQVLVDEMRQTGQLQKILPQQNI